jgi:hypothetical protein
MTPTKHGECVGKPSTEYRILGGMLERCENPNATSYPLYGARGIRVCDRWKGPDGIVNFIADMGRRPSPNHSIDRIDNNGDYEPGNCRWATAREQRLNTRPRRSWAKRLHAFGETKSAREWAADSRCTVAEATIHYRISHGWSEHDAVTVGPMEAPRKTVGDHNGARMRPETRPRGSRVVTSLLDEERVARLKRRRQEGATYADLVSEFGVSKTQVGRILTGKSWRHVAG